MSTGSVLFITPEFESLLMNRDIKCLYILNLREYLAYSNCTFRHMEYRGAKGLHATEKGCNELTAQGTTIF